jgi:DNA-nicking Smr family endonuclease
MAAEMNTQVAALHSNASANIFSQRNTNDNGVIDMHGLHPGECVVHLKSAIHNLKAVGYTGRVLVVTGTGHHSRKGAKSIYPVIQQYLIKNNFKPKEATMPDGRGGVISFQM